ncbi:Putative oxidoreductase [Corynebacterium ciconiae DSM 44920]|uniref:geranylgeranyl reductase family protein n=1 Tax=Corynebacterium ciconiae TaxID=227319 RepID=UPI0003620D30|nr:geranylgeranyl reductase family protein [Corynebacterium ciconiae]WKD60276.1 Putative oxidoreductase [Corynebacterium ciconiae DSM 44920]
MAHPDVAVDVLIVGAGPAGSAAAYHAAHAGQSVLLIDAASFPRDKTCGDGLTPRAIKELHSLHLAHQVTSRYRNQGLFLHGYGGDVQAPWPESTFGRLGSAMKRRDFDTLLFRHAQQQDGVDTWENAEALSPQLYAGRIEQVEVRHGGEIRMVRPRMVLVADGVRSSFGRKLGRQWHREQVYGIAARAYCTTARGDDPWMHSHVELRDEQGHLQPGYGWIFPLGSDEVNIGCGALSTAARPAQINTKKLLLSYAAQQREHWQLEPSREIASALLPMGGAISSVAGANWMLLGDAAALVNPLNGEGIDYGMESARLAVELMGHTSRVREAWPRLLREHYGESFRLARRLARVLTYPQFLPAAGPVAMRGIGGRVLMPAAARLMGNLITDSDRDLVARVWHGAQRSLGWVDDTPLWD